MEDGLSELQKSSSRMSDTIRSIQSQNSGEISEDEAKKNDLIRILLSENEALKRKKDEVERNCRDLIGPVERELQIEKEEKEKGEKQIIEIKKNLEEERKTRMEFSNKIKNLEDQINNEKVNTQKALKSKLEEENKRREAEDNLFKINEENQNNLHKLKEYDLKLQQTQQKIAELELSLNPVREELETEIEKSKQLEKNLNLITKKLKSCEGNLKRIQLEKDQEGQKLQSEIQLIQDQLVESETNFEIYQKKSAELQNQFDSEKKSRIECQQNEKIAIKVRDEQKNKVDKLESQYKEELKLRQDFENKLRISQEKLLKSLEKEKESFNLFEEKEEQRRIAEEKFRIEQDLKENAINEIKLTQISEKQEIQKRRNSEKEIADLKYENEKLRSRIDEITKSLSIANEKRIAFEVKYSSQLKENEDLNKKCKEKDLQKLEAIAIQQKETENKENALKYLAQMENSIKEQAEKNRTIEQECIKLKDEFQKEKQKADKSASNEKEEYIRRIKAEEEKGKSDGDNWKLKRENERMKFELAQIKKKFGEEIIEKERKDADEIILIYGQYKLKGQIKNLKNENNRIKEKKGQIEKIKQMYKQYKLKQQIKNLKKENNRLKEKKEQIEKIKYTIPYGIPIISSDPNHQYYDIFDVGTDQKKFTWKSGIQYPTISFSPALENGIYLTEVEFGGNGDSGIGIVRDSYSLNSQGNPYEGTNCQHMATFGGYNYSGGQGCVSYKGNKTEGNSYYSENQTVKLEYDSGKGTLILFINGTQQPVFVSGIREKVRFILSLWTSCGNCTIKSLKKLSAPTSVQMSNGNAVQW